MSINRFILLISLLPIFNYAQIPTSWINTYGNANREIFYDIYAVSEEGYIMCGVSDNKIFVVRINNDGRVIWDNIYNDIDNDGDIAYSVIETDNGNFIIGGERNGSVNILKINSDGEVLWWNDYADGQCNALIELKAGDVIAAGKSERQGYLAKITEEGRLLWEETYQPGIRGEFNALRETENGIVIVGLAQRDEYRGGSHIWVFKTDFNGEEQWSRFHLTDPQRDGVSIGYNIVSSPDGGFSIGGWRTNRDEGSEHFYLLKVTNLGLFSWVRDYNRVFENRFEQCRALADNDARGGYVLVGTQWGPDGQGRIDRPIVLKAGNNGNEEWRNTYEFDEDERFGRTLNHLYSVIIGHDGSYLAAGTAQNEVDQTGQDGLVIKLEPEILEPIIFYYLPEDTILIVLPQDSIQFIVRARDQLGREMEYLWIFDGEDTLSTDTTYTHTFEQMGEHTIKCQVSNGEFTSAITWHVTVTDLYIASHTPDSTTFSVRRGSSLDFNLNYRATDDGPVNTEWWLSGDQGGLISDEPQTTITFDDPGDFNVEGLVYRGETEDNIIWNISVRSVVSEFRPQQNNITAYMDTTITFAVEPFNPESPNLLYYWLLDGDTLSYTQELVWDFIEPREYSVIAHVYDGEEGDTLVWNVTVLPDDVGGGIGIPPYAVGLSVFPNPFNAELTIKYSLPRSDVIQLAIYSIDGREVAQLASGYHTAGNYVANWNAISYSSGLYFIYFKTAQKKYIQKIILTK